MPEKERTNGIQAFLDAIDQQMRLAKSGKIVLFGTRRHGFSKENMPTNENATNDQQTNEQQCEEDAT